jgi:hypothetical protein
MMEKSHRQKEIIDCEMGNTVWTLRTGEGMILSQGLRSFQSGTNFLMSWHHEKLSRKLKRWQQSFSSENEGHYVPI